MSRRRRIQRELDDSARRRTRQIRWVSAGVAAVGLGALITYSYFNRGSAEANKSPEYGIRQNVNPPILPLTPQDNSKPLDKKPFEKYEPPGWEEERTPTERNMQIGLERVIERAPKGSKVTDIKFVRGYSTKWVMIEPDQSYSKELIEEAKISISHMLNFLGSEYLKRPNLEFIVPRDAGKIKPTWDSVLPVYLVAAVGPRNCLVYSANIDGIRHEVKIDYDGNSVSGEFDLSHTWTATEKGVNVVEGEKAPMFYTTRIGRRVDLLETPAIEVLHACLRPYTIANMNKRLENAGQVYHHTIDSVLKEEANREELMAHAVSVLWWKQYNLDRKLVSDAELEERFKDYSNVARFRDVVEFSRYIEKSGINMAIMLYALDYSKLFGDFARQQKPQSN